MCENGRVTTTTLIGSRSVAALPQIGREVGGGCRRTVSCPQTHSPLDEEAESKVDFSCGEVVVWEGFDEGAQEHDDEGDPGGLVTGGRVAP